MNLFVYLDFAFVAASEWLRSCYVFASGWWGEDSDFRVRTLRHCTLQSTGPNCIGKPQENFGAKVTVFILNRPRNSYRRFTVFSVLYEFLSMFLFKLSCPAALLFWFALACFSSFLWFAVHLCRFRFTLTTSRFTLGSHSVSLKCVHCIVLWACGCP